MNYWITGAALAAVCFICATTLGLTGHWIGAVAMFFAGLFCVPA